MKLPVPQHEAHVAFYRGVLGPEPCDARPLTVGSRFGDQDLWLDRCPGMGQAETWFQLVCGARDAAGAHPRVRGIARGIARCGEIGPLGFWINSPASVGHLVCKDVASWS